MLQEEALTELHKSLEEKDQSVSVALGVPFSPSLLTRQNM